MSREAVSTLRFLCDAMIEQTIVSLCGRRGRIKGIRQAFVGDDDKYLVTIDDGRHRWDVWVIEGQTANGLAVDSGEDEYGELSITAGEAWERYGRPFIHGEGWDLFSTSARGLEIERIDDNEVFDTDADAIIYVRFKALAGSRPHMLAVLIDGKEPEDRVTISRSFAREGVRS